MSAGRPTRALTKAEFEHLLQRAAERDVYREPRLFTLAELVEAGQELGLDPLSVQEVYGEYQQQVTRPLRPVRAQPLGSHIRLYKQGDSMQLLIPPVRRHNVWEVAAFGSMAALFAGMGFVSEMWLALPAAVVLAALGAYRWFQGTVGSGHDLRLFRDGSGLLMRVKGARTSSYPLVAGQVHARLASVTETSQHGSHTTHYVALDHATQTHPLMEDFSHPERAWVVDEIESWLGR